MSACYVTDRYHGRCNMEDLCCLYGEGAYADACGPVAFLCGPGLDVPIGSDEEVFKTVEGTVLHFVLDAVLFRISRDGYQVLDLLDLPECS